MDTHTNTQNDSKELERYIEQTLMILELSSPSVSDMADADNYRSRLIRNFIRIGELSRDNGSILAKHYYPIVYAPPPLSAEDVESMRLFSNSLVRASELSYLDIPLVYQQAKRLLREADLSGNERDRILALDGMVMVSYAMINITERLYPVNRICLDYQKTGIAAGERLLSYLAHDKFRKLDDECKELILINARYIRVVLEVDGVPQGSDINRKNLRLMLDALALADDPFYREQLPSYDWDYHIFRTLEYIASFTELANKQGFEADQIRTINACTKRLFEIYTLDAARYGSIDNSKMVDVCVCRNAYLAGELDLASYKKELERIFHVHMVTNASTVSLAFLYAPLEYMLVLDKDALSADDIRFLEEFYSCAIRFMHKTPKRDSLMFLLTSISLILTNFIEIPGGMSVEDMCLSMLAAIHPPSYIHSRSVADFARCLAKHLFRKRPALFAGIPALDGITGTAEREDVLTDFVYHAALCHDFGKLMISEIILTYGRNLLDMEFDLVRAHPGVGAHLLKKYDSTAPYADIAYGHHKWFNNRGGYPEDFDMETSPYQAVIAIITCADCLDAATDAVGRSYKEGKTLERFLSELHEGSSTHYAPYLAELLADPDVRADIELLLATGRDENYRRTYHILNRHEANP